MKFLAILKDSYREAVEGRIFQVLLVLALLVTLLVAGLSFQPLSVEDDLGRFTGFINGMVGMNPQAAGAKLLIEDFQQTNSTPEPWLGDYRFEIVIPDKETAKKVGLPSNAGIIQQLVRQQCYYLENLKVTEEPARNAGEARFLVTSHGTKVTDEASWPHGMRWMGLSLWWLNALLNDHSLRQEVYRVENTLVNGFGAWITVLFSVVITAAFIPNVLRKGTIDLVITKPVARAQFLVYKYLGGLLFIALPTAATVGLVWLVIGWRSGIWAPQFLVVIPLLVFYFAVLYSVSVLLGVTTRSTIVAIVGTLIVWAVFWIIGWTNARIRDAAEVAAEMTRPQSAQQQKKADKPEEADSDWVEKDEPPTPPGFPSGVITTLRIIYKVTPRTYDLDTISTKLIADGVLSPAERQEKRLDRVKFPPWAATIGISLAFIALMLALASWRFVKRDF